MNVRSLIAGALVSSAVVCRLNAAADEFTSHVLPILAQRCHGCHSHAAKMANGGLVLDSAGAIRKGGDSGVAIVPGSSDQSPLVVRITSDDPDVQMPPEGERLAAEEVAAIRAWIDRGAPVPAGEAAVEASADAPHWAFAPLVRPPLPPVAEGSWPRGPIDRFVLARLESEHLAPSPQADRRTLIRRLWFDLAGLPPAPQEVAAFLADDAPDAWERAVDRLLASPRYGERWARHWLDVARFAETHGHDQDRVREFAWPYRDWVVDALNADKPAARFIQEQIAADALFPDEPGLVPALGFLAAGPWDESSLRDIREDSIDREIGRYLDRDDIVTAVMSAFASLSAHCARCHDHKFDPIPQRDYYALQAVFAGVEKATRTYDVDPAVARQRDELAHQLAALERRAPELVERLLSAESAAAAEQWAQTRLTAGREAVWQPLVAAAASADAGTTLVAEADGSFLAKSDAAPPTETYVVQGRLPPGAWTGLRLELLPHESLPQRGPGRADNGNLHLSELAVLASTADAAGAAHRTVPLRTALADFNQDGWTIAHAIDGRSETAWGIYPRVGEPHEAVFEFAEPLVATADSQVTIRLAQLHGAKHTIGRFRLSLTTSPTPLALPGWSATIGRIASKPMAERTADEQLELAAHYWRTTWSAQLAALPPPRRVYAAASQFEPDGSHKPPPGPRPVQVLRRGDIRKPIEAAAPGALSCIAALPARFDLSADADESARRAALAHWLTDPANPLPWRSLANRLWQHHFGRGLVDTPNDFGHMGARPSHPELLDWLAAELRDSGGSLKALHRLLVTSATYRQSSTVGSAERGARSAEHASAVAEPPSALAVDPDNRLLWRMNRQRLDAEIVRDAMLAVAGQLDLAQGGPSARQFELRPGVHVTPIVDYRQFDWHAPAGHRRSVYRFVFRTLPDPFMETMDFADASQSTAVRSESATPLAALALWNNAFVLHQADALAQRLSSESAPLSEQLRRAAELAFSRAPTDEELAEWTAYAQRHGLAALCRVLLNSSEFLYVE